MGASASAHVSTETQNSGRNSPDTGAMSRLDVTLFRNVLMRGGEDVCHLQRNALTEPASVRRGAAHTQGVLFYDSGGGNVTPVNLQEFKNKI